MEKQKVRVGFIILILSFLFMSVGYSVLQESFSINGTVNLKSGDTPGEEEEIAYELEVSLSKWQAGRYEYQYNPFTLTYQGTENTTSWNIVFDIPDDATISSCWNVQCVLKDGYLTIHSNSNNSILTPNQTLTNFGFQFSTTMDNYELNTKKVNFYTPTRPNPLEITITDGLNVTHTKGNGWNDGGMYVSQFTLTISNDSEIDLTSWQIEIDKPSIESSIVNFWGCEFVETDDKFIIFGNSETRTIASGSSRNMGLQIKLPTVDSDLEILTFFGKGIVIES